MPPVQDKTCLKTVKDCISLSECSTLIEMDRISIGSRTVMLGSLLSGEDIS